MIGLSYGFGNILTTLLMELPHSRKQEYEGSCFFPLHRYKRHQQSGLPIPLADKIGLKLSAKACFDPTASPSCGSRLRFCSTVLTLALHRMFKRLGALEKSNGGLNVSFLNTHPASDERVKVSIGLHGLLMYDSLINLPKSNWRLYCQKHSPYELWCVVGYQITWAALGGRLCQGLAVDRRGIIEVEHVFRVLSKFGFMFQSLITRSTFLKHQ
jgi:hypothetical protein